MSAVVGDRFAVEITGALRHVVKLSPRISMRHRNLNRLAIELLREINGALNGLVRFPRQPDNEIAVNVDADFLAILHEVASHLSRSALFDVLQNLRIARFEPDN